MCEYIDLITNNAMTGPRRLISDIDFGRHFEIVRHSVEPASSGLCRYPSQAEAVPDCDGRRCKMALMPNLSLPKFSSGDEPLTFSSYEKLYVLAHYPLNLHLHDKL